MTNPPILWAMTVTGPQGTYAQPGDRVSVRARWSTHEGIYLGQLRGLPGFWVIHNAWNRGVCLDQFQSFSHDKPVKLVTRVSPHWAPVVIQRAVSQLGRPYKLFDFNCQDFTSAVFSGRPESYERDAAAGLGALMLFLV